MDFKTTISIAGQGLSAQRARLNVIGSNLANANTTRTREGGPYQRRNVLLKATNITDPFGSLLEGVLNEAPNGVEISKVSQSKGAARLVFDPGHPDADAEGYVAMPTVNVVDEMVDMMTSSRAYEANATLVQSIKALAKEAINIGE